MSSNRRKNANLLPVAKIMLVSMVLLTVGVAPATACEKHLNGHQNSAETNSEVQSR
jgi:hypothetical protein